MGEGRRVADGGEGWCCDVEVAGEDEDGMGADFGGGGTGGKGALW